MDAHGCTGMNPTRWKRTTLKSKILRFICLSAGLFNRRILRFLHKLFAVVCAVRTCVSRTWGTTPGTSSRLFRARLQDRGPRYCHKLCPTILDSWMLQMLQPDPNSRCEHEAEQTMCGCFSKYPANAGSPLLPALQSCDREAQAQSGACSKISEGL